MKRILSFLTNKKVLAITTVLLFAMTTVLSLAYFTDRVELKASITTTSFSADGYAITRTPPVGPFAAGEDVVAKILETNPRDDDIKTEITLTVTWDSPDPDSTIFGNANAADNATLTFSGEGFAEDVTFDSTKYTLVDNKTITCVIPCHVIPATATNYPFDLSLYIPESFHSTGNIEFTFGAITVSQSPVGFTDDFDPGTSLDYDVRVGWAASSLPANNGKTLMGFLTETAKAGEYGIVFEFPFSAKESPMKDFATRTGAKWSYYKDDVVSLTFIKGMTSIGDYAFPDFSKVTSVSFPDTIASIGTSAFDASGLTGEVTIPGTVTNIESLAFGNLPKVNVFTFGHTSNTLTLPDNTSAGRTNLGAFYVQSHVDTTVNTTVPEIMYGYRWHDGFDNRRLIPTLAEHESWQYTTYDYDNEIYETHIDYNVVETINIVDYYIPDGTETAWEASDNSVPGTVTAYLSKDGKTLTVAGNGYGSVFANEDSSWAFSSYDNYGFSVLKRVNGAEIFDTSKMVYSCAMFADNDVLEYVNVSNWNTSNLIDTGWGYFGMFGYCPKLQNVDVATKTITRADGSTYTAWDVSKVENFERMFFGDDSITAIDVSGWDTGSGIYFGQMFTYTGVSELAVGHWDMTNATQTYGMFANCTNLKSIDVATKTITRPNGTQYTAWNVGKITNMQQMFEETGIQSIDLSTWTNSVVTDTEAMFQFCYNLTEVNIDGWNLSNVTNSYTMFRWCSALEELTIPASLTVIDDYFAEGCTSLTTIRFLHAADADISLYSAGSSGPFYVPTYVETTVIAENTEVLNHNWGRENRAKYPVTFNVNGGTLPDGTITSFCPGENNALPVPTKEGYTFDGWYESEGLTGTAVTSLSGKYRAVTLYAKWRTPTVTLMYLDDVTADEVLQTSSSASLPTPSRAGYTFNGWYLAKETVSSTAITSFTSINAEYPWTQDANGVWSSGNAGVGGSSSGMQSDVFSVGQYGYVSFDWRSNGEANYDYLGFDILNVDTGAYLSGQTEPTFKNCYQNLRAAASTEYTNVKVDLPIGNYRIVFMYGKDGGGDTNEDMGFVKNVTTNSRTYTPSDVAVPAVITGDVLLAAKYSAN